MNGPRMNQTTSRTCLIKRIQNIIIGLVESISQNNAPMLVIPGYDKSGNPINRTYKFSNRSNTYLVMIVQLLARIYRLIFLNTTVTTRAIYYEEPSYYKKQTRIILMLYRIANLLDVPPWELRILSSGKGLVAGDLSIKTKSGITKCSSTIIPMDLPFQSTLKSLASFVLVVEKDTIFEKLLTERFIEKHGPCIMITGKGYPDLNTRLLLNLIWEQLELPIFSLFDGDPYGVDIMHTYRFGSIENKFLAVPVIKWLGIHYNDIKVFNPKYEPLTDKDRRKYNNLKLKLAHNIEICNEIQNLVNGGIKCEIEWIANISKSYLTDVYIPSKLARKQVI